MAPNNEISDGSLRVVLDTNVLIDSTNDPFNAASQILDAVLAGTIIAFGTSATEREYHNISDRFVLTDEDQERIESYQTKIQKVTPEHVDVALDDPEDYKFLQAAVGGKADVLITSDRHLLDIGEVGNMRIVRPDEAVALIEDQATTGGEWQSWVQGLGIK